MAASQNSNSNGLAALSLKLCPSCINATTLWTLHDDESGFTSANPGISPKLPRPDYALAGDSLTTGPLLFRISWLLLLQVVGT